MKRLLLFIFIVMTFSLTSYEISMTGSQLSVTGDAGELFTSELNVGLGNFTKLTMDGYQQGAALGEPDLPHYTRMVALPQRGNWRIADICYESRELTLDSPVVPSGWEDLESFSGYRGNTWYPEEIVTISSPGIMRDNRFSQISVAAVQYNPGLGRLRIIENLDLELTLDESDPENPYEGRELPPSPAFTKLAEDLIFGFDGQRNDNDYAGNLLIICRSSVQSYVEVLAEWKRQLGYRAEIRNTSQTGSSNNSIKNYIQNAYNNWDYPPDYVLLIGDVTGNYSIPAFYCEGYMYATAVTDHDYALLQGTDYFPDVLLGRISIQSTTHITTAISKIMNYEGDPYMTNTAWYTKGLMMSVIEDGWGQEYFSGRETVIQAKEKLMDFTYTQVDTFIAPYQTSTSQLRSLINTGYTFLNYRGFGSANYWNSTGGGHMMESSDINMLANGWMLPMVTSIVCGGGDFADNNYTTCFGETWVVSGSSSNPRGAIAFIGPSEHDTKTPFNNCNDLGIYQGITQEENFGSSSMMLRGKMEMYNNFPFCHSWGGSEDSDQFYFYVYNLLGDPTLNIWTDVPKECELNIVGDIPAGQNYLEINITSDDDVVEGFRIAITTDGELLAAGMTNSNGNAYIPVLLTAGEYTITASRYGYTPAVETIEIEAGDHLGISDYSSSTMPVAGNTFELDLIIYNYGTLTATSVAVELLNYDDHFIPQDDSQAIAYLIPGAEQMLTFNVETSEEWCDGEFGQLFCNITSSLGSETGLVELGIQAPEMIFTDAEITSSSGSLMQGELCQVDLVLHNGGSVSSSDLTAVLVSLNNNAVISSSVSEYSGINSGSNVTNSIPFEILPSDVITGQVASMQLSLYDGAALVQTIAVTIPIGDVDENDATFDSYGYMAIESDDEGDFEVPVYEWLDISPFSGGDGEYLDSPHMHETDDGWIDQLELPFDFQYYGEVFDRITVCQNGYFSFGNTTTLFFRNKAIPSGYGPSGMVCPFWEDLTQGYVYYWYDEDNHRFMLEWKNMRLVFNPNQRQYFQVILRDPEYYPTETGDGEIIFMYQEVHNIDQNENYASVGIESPDKTQGLQITFADMYGETVHELDDERAILFTPVDPQAGGIMYGDVDANGAVEAYDASIALQYFVGIDPGAVAPLPWPDWRILRSDVDGNGTVEAYDGSLILQYYVGIIDHFPVEEVRTSLRRK
ncbi:MAG: hypothetical protein K9N06_08445 [Candidatus Cloacimonetes bacterium]|nr:hypothetical protein [Candidatus Cloacimonadota bacterium]